MSAIVAILRAAHCRSTHHYFAIDALQEVATVEGQRLGQLLLANFAQYLRGAKEPDTAFKDFENHVVHVADGFWGGAARTAEKWLTRTHQFLARQDWGQAAYSIGVLSHYFTDPWMPLHTAQSPRETVFHRPLEWSVCCAYEELFQRAMTFSDADSFDVPPGEHWLTDAIHAGAKLAHADYDSILDDYTLSESHRSPALALGERSKEILAKIFVWVLTGWGSAIDRIAQDCGTNIPEFSLALPTLMATIQAPAKKIVASVANAEQRREVAAILDEFHTTGKVTRHLSSEQIAVKRARAKLPSLCPQDNEVQRALEHPWVANAMQPRKSSPRLPNTVTAAPFDAPRSPPREESWPTDQEVAGTHDSALPEESIDPPTEHEPEVRDLPSSTNDTESASSPSPRQKTDHEPRQANGPTRKRLEPSDPVVDAPAIGPKTAQRLMANGIQTVSQLLQADPNRLVSQLRTRWITAEVISGWQLQARLACQIPGLSAAGAGLLVLAGITSSEAFQNHTAENIHHRMCKAAETAHGQRLLRDKPPPSLVLVEKWQSRIQKSRPAA